MYSAEKTETVRADIREATKFYSAKVGSLVNIYAAAVYSEPGDG